MNNWIPPLVVTAIAVAITVGIATLIKWDMESDWEEVAELCAPLKSNQWDCFRPIGDNQFELCRPRQKDGELYCYSSSTGIWTKLR